jgi:predicted transcriptional regulator
VKTPRPRSEIPPPLELECLKVLWEMGEASVRDVRDRLGENRVLAYTTVMTLLDRLVRRGSATRHKQGRSFLYAPRISRDRLRQLALDRLVETFFDGSPRSLAEYLDAAPPARASGREQPRAAAPEESSLDPALL